MNIKFWTIYSRADVKEFLFMFFILFEFLISFSIVLLQFYWTFCFIISTWHFLLFLSIQLLHSNFTLLEQNVEFMLTRQQYLFLRSFFFIAFWERWNGMNALSHTYLMFHITKAINSTRPLTHDAKLCYLMRF